MIARALIAVLSLLPLCASAQSTQPLWEAGVGIGGLRMPHYRGSEQNHDYVLPVPYGVYRGHILRATREGARAVLFETERIDFDLSLSATAPTQSEDNRARTGMPDLAPTLEIGPNLNYTLWRAGGLKLDLRLPARFGFTLQRDARTIGWTASPVLNLDLQAAGWNWGAQVGPVYGSRAFHAYWYDVAPAYVTTDRAAYSAKGGYAGWRWTASASRRLGDMWIGAYLRADSVKGAVFESSPLVRRGTNLSFGLAVSWVLAVSDERVADHD